MTSFSLVMLLCCTASLGSIFAPPAKPDKKEDDRLGERLIRKVTTDVDEDLMERIVRMMHEAAQKLEIEFDAGDNTQQLQRRITDQLDDAIKLAASQRRTGRRRLRPTTSDKRRMPSAAKRPSEEDSATQQGDADSPSTGSVDVRGDRTDGGLSGGDLRESRRSWGHLPRREREEVLQGIGERFLERYRGWIDRYYRALQEAEE